MKKIAVIISCMLLIGCSATKNIQKTPKTTFDPNKQLVEQVIVAQPEFTSLHAPKTKVKLDYQNHSYSVNGAVTLVKDSLLIISLQPLLGIEIYRCEMVSQHITLVDKMNKRYVRLTYEELKNKTGVSISFQDIQALFMKHIFMPGVPQEELKSQSVQVENQDNNSSITFKDNLLSYIFLVEKPDLQLQSTKLMLDAANYILVQYQNQSLVNNIIYPQQMILDMHSGQLAATCHITFQQLNFDTKVNTTLTDLSRYTATSLNKIIN